MRLLFDHNLSPRLVKLLSDIFPKSDHVYTLGLDQVADGKIWEYAKANACVIVTKDADFGDLSVIKGFPPKVIWIRRGNCTTREIERLIRSHRDQLALLDTDPTVGIIPIF